MSRKLGDVAIALIILTFVIGGFSSIIYYADKSTGIDSGVVSSDLKAATQSLNGTYGLADGITTKTDQTGTFAVEDKDQELEGRGAESAGFTNILSKNILVKFVTLLSERIPGFAYVAGFLLLFVSVTISILFLRFFWGDNKV